MPESLTPAQATENVQEEFDFLLGATCNPDAPEECEACQ